HLAGAHRRLGRDVRPRLRRRQADGRTAHYAHQVARTVGSAGAVRIHAGGAGRRIWLQAVANAKMDAHMSAGRPTLTPRPTLPEPPRFAGRFDSALQWLIVVVAGYYLLAYLVVAVMRMGYPFELEWLEGITLEHVRRILAGQPIYVAPSLSFVPLNYTPLFFQVSAGVAAVLGPSLF